MTLSLNEAQELIENSPRQSSSFYYSEWEWWSRGEVGTKLETSVELVENERSDDYGGGNIHMVFKVSTNDQVQYFRKDGRWDSYVEDEWDGDFYEVTPVAQTKTSYEKV